MLAHRLRRWPNTKTALGERLVSCVFYDDRYSEGSYDGGVCGVRRGRQLTVLKERTDTVTYFKQGKTDDSTRGE